MKLSEYGIFEYPKCAHSLDALPETHLLVAAQIFPTAQIFLELKFILGIQDEP